MTVCSCGRMECAPGMDLCAMCEDDAYEDAERDRERREDDERDDFGFDPGEILF